MSTLKAKKITVILLFFILITVFFAFFNSLSAEARVTQAHIDKLREDRQSIQARMENVQAKIDALEFDMLSETVKKNVLEDRIILTGFEIENIVATIEEYNILITDKEHQITIAVRNEENYMQQYKERVRSMEENGIITYLEIIFDSTSFVDLLARIDFVTDIMRADERIHKNLVNARLDTMAAREDLVQTKESMEKEYILLESKEADLLNQVDELDIIITKLEDDLTAAGELHRQLSDDEKRMEQTINKRVEELRKQQQRDRERAAREAAAIRAWGSGSNTGTQVLAATSSESTGSSGGSDSSDSSEKIRKNAIRVRTIY